MKIITDKRIIEKYSAQFPFQQYFSFDISKDITLAHYETDEFIIQEGLALTHIFYMVEGVAKLYKTHKNGKVSLINYLEGPCLLGEMEALGILETPKGIQAQTTCLCFRLPFMPYRDQIRTDIRFLYEVCVFLGNKAISNMDVSTSNQVYPLKNRLAKFILMTAHHNLYTEKHTEDAAYLGVSYRHLLYTISALCREGILEKTASGYLISNYKALQELCASL